MKENRYIVEEPRRRSHFEAMERLQIEVWNRETSLPVPMLWVAVETGGLALVARQPEKEEVVGFCLGVPAFDGKEAWLWSHMAAVKEGIRSHGIGRALKYRQYRWAREEGFPLIT
ncbi:MAG: GNAT family N-acetyltransferase, partial [Bacillota bacterium]|nr:GNAT family N-acetyltransferase [Bacillota bacterium]